MPSVNEMKEQVDLIVALVREREGRYSSRGQRGQDLHSVWRLTVHEEMELSKAQVQTRLNRAVNEQRLAMVKPNRNTKLYMTPTRYQEIAAIEQERQAQREARIHRLDNLGARLGTTVWETHHARGDGMVAVPLPWLETIAAKLDM